MVGGMPLGAVASKPLLCTARHLPGHVKHIVHLRVHNVISGGINNPPCGGAAAAAAAAARHLLIASRDWRMPSGLLCTRLAL